MTWVKMPIQEQWEDSSGNPASGYVIKAYLPGTTTVTPMAIDKNGTTTVTSVTLNANGVPAVSGNQVVLYIDREFKYGVFADSTAAAANSSPTYGFYDNVKIDAFISGNYSSIVDDYTEMLALTPGNYTAGDVITVTDDGVAGQFVVVAGSATDDGGVIKTNATWNSASKHLERRYSGPVNVKWFGALGDGSTDDTSAFQLALDSYSDIYIPEGTFKIAGTISFVNNGTTLKGAGMERTILNGTNTSADNIIESIGTGPDAPDSIQHISIRDLSIVGVTGGGSGIYFEYTMDSTVERVRISDCGDYGLFTDNCFSNSFRYLRFTDNENHNMRLGAASNEITVIGCRYLNAGTSNNKSGLLISDGFAITVDSCSFESNGIGLEIGQGSNMSIRGCYWEANRNQSLRVGSTAAAHNISIIACYMDGLVGGVATTAYNILISNNSTNIVVDTTQMGNSVTANIGGTWTNLIENGNKYFGTGTARNSSLTVEGLHFNSTQVPSSDVNTLDDYEEGTLSTEIGISFGGGTTGIAYGSRSGRYIKIGKLVKFTFLITLTSKGSSSGNARITGLPFTAAAAAATGTGQVNQYYNFTGLTSAPMIYVENGLTTATLFEFGSASAASITDSRFTNTSSIWGTIIYEASA